MLCKLTDSLWHSLTLTHRGWRHALGLLMLSALIIAGTSSTSLAVYPAPWPDETGIGGPGQWIPFTHHGIAISDCKGSDDPSNGGTTPQGNTDISDCPNVNAAFVYYDDTNDVLAFRLRIQSDSSPLVSGTDKSGNAPLPNATTDPFAPSNYTLTFDTDGDGFRTRDLMVGVQAANSTDVTSA